MKEREGEHERRRHSGAPQDLEHIVKGRRVCEELGRGDARGALQSQSDEDREALTLEQRENGHAEHEWL